MADFSSWTIFIKFSYILGFFAQRCYILSKKDPQFCELQISRMNWVLKTSTYLVWSSFSAKISNHARGYFAAPRHMDREVLSNTVKGYYGYTHFCVHLKLRLSTPNSPGNLQEIFSNSRVLSRIHIFHVGNTTYETNYSLFYILSIKLIFIS